jgi:hypothetical protein
VSVEAADLLFASCGIESAILLWATVGQTLGMSLLLVQLAFGPFTRGPQVYDLRHSFLRRCPAELPSAI